MLSPSSASNLGAVVHEDSEPESIGYEDVSQEKRRTRKVDVMPAQSW